MSVSPSRVAASQRWDEQPVQFTGPSGALEGVWSRPRYSASPSIVAIICHPHPLHGGNLNNKIAHTLAQACCNLGASAVRFNFRGVGASAGRYDHGQGETEDLIAVIETVRTQQPGAAVWLAGFSFGAYVALRATQHVEVERLITVAPPVNLYDCSELAPPVCPWLLIQGRADEVVPVKDVARWAGRLYPAPESIYLDDVDHYFHGKLNLLQSLLIDRIASHDQACRAAGA